MARILLVHDDVGEAARLRRALRDGGHAVDVAPGAADARAVAPGHDALVVDAACDGGEALAWARRLAAEGSAPPAVIVGGDDPGAVAAPADPAALRAAVQAALGRPRPSRPPVPPEPPPLPPRFAPRPAIARGAEAALRALFGARTRAAPVVDARARLESLAARARASDYFEVLRIPRGCTGEEARLAADTLLATIERDLAGEAAADPALAPMLSDARQVALDARDVLGDDALRAAYRDGLPPEAPSGLENGAPSN